jgi:uncharacterized membrane protein YhaH (DUF805 family)
MKMTFGDLWRPSGTINRGAYALVGVLGFAIKHNLDRVVAGYGFHRTWGLFNYWVPVHDVARITELRGSEATFLGTMVALSLPFIWVGVALTMKRLRSAGLPTQLVALFFLPVLNLFFFLVLCLLPERDLSAAEVKTAESESKRKRKRKQSYLARVFPESAMGSAALSLLITVPAGLGIALLGVQVLGNYGWGVFVALPFTMGFAAALVYGIRQPRSLGGCMGVGSLAVALLGTALLALAFEGVVCLIMAIPIALPLAAFWRSLRVWGAAATLVSDGGSGGAFSAAAFCAGHRVGGAPDGEAGTNFCGANGTRHPGPAGKSLAGSGCIF